jgi:hypothetical protein
MPAATSSHWQRKTDLDIRAFLFVKNPLTSAVLILLKNLKQVV